MIKYIIKNCPCYMSQPEADCWADQLSWCENCTDCVLKQIVEKCKKVQELEYQKGGLKYRSPSKAKFGREILQLLDIEEILGD